MPQPHAYAAPPGGAGSLPGRALYSALLEEARERTLALIEPLSDEDIHRQHSDLLSPIVWDLGHIAAFEDLWLCQRAGGLPPLREDLAEVYDATETPRARRSELPMLRLADAIPYMEAVRERALGVLELVDLSGDGDRLNANGFVWEMLVQHEHQHNETMLQALKLAPAGTYAPSRRPLPGPPASDPRGTVRVEAGPFVMGFRSRGFAYDNERPPHEVDLPAFEIDRVPVTNGDFREFVDDGGYERRELWSDEGWAWRQAEQATGPLYWDGAGNERDFERIRPIEPSLPVMHVSWFEADAYARWRGMRLPTEGEWEKAAAGASAHEANLDQLAFGPAPAGAYPDGVSDHGMLGAIGDCWEWTSSPFTGYPGFEAFPYPDYSEVFFGGDYRVLRGASWAARPRVS